MLGCTLSYTYYILILYLDSISSMTCSIFCRLSMTLYGLTEWKINEWMNEYTWLESSKLIPSECTRVKFDLGNSYKLIVKEHGQGAIMRSEIQQIL